MWAAQPLEEKKQQFEQWFSDYGNAVLHTCFIYLSDRCLAEDAMQETFVKVWKSMDRFEGRNNCSAKTWIVRIAINTCRDYKRTGWKKHIDLTKSVDDLPPALLRVEQESRDIFLDILRLPEKYRQVILVHIYDQCTIRETAGILNLSPATVNRRLKKAYSLLRVECREGGGVDGEW